MAAKTRLTPARVRALRRLFWVKHINSRCLSQLYDISMSAVWDCVTYRTWKNVRDTFGADEITREFKRFQDCQEAPQRKPVEGPRMRQWWVYATDKKTGTKSKTGPFLKAAEAGAFADDERPVDEWENVKVTSLQHRAWTDKKYEEKKRGSA